MMNVSSYYGVPERKMAKLFLIVSVIFYLFLFLLTFLLRNCGGLTDGWPVDVWRVLDAVIVYGVVGLAALALFVLFIVPLWFFVRKGQQSGGEAFDAAKNTVGIVLLVTLFSSFFVFQTICTVDENVASIQIQHFAHYDDIGANEFRVFMIPRSATDIKVYIDQGVRDRTCDISCTVGMEGLLEFAKENGYRFERREYMIGFADSCVTREFEIDTANITNYLFSSVGLEGDTSEGSARSGFGNALFVYDIANSRLVGSYWD